jgi:cellulose 1,4-beta-cellobiosidase
MRVILLALFAFVAFVAGQSTNPFSGKTFYVNPSFQAEIQSSINTATDATAKANLQKMQQTASAYWLDVIAKVSNPNSNSTSDAAGILADAAKKSPPQLVVLIVYDLPNRDCHAKASNGEICCNPNSNGTCNYDQGGDCANGLSTYKSKYIDALAVILQKYQATVPIVLIIEPDSLPNLATNMADPHCGNSATVTAYEQGIPYAIQTLRKACPTCGIYVDAAHSGWLGWQNNMQSFAQEVKKTWDYTLTCSRIRYQCCKLPTNRCHVQFN